MGDRRNPPQCRWTVPPSPYKIGRVGLHGTTKTGTTQGATDSGPDQAHKDARSVGLNSRSTGNRMLRLVRGRRLAVDMSSLSNEGKRCIKDRQQEAERIFLSLL